MKKRLITLTAVTFALALPAFGQDVVAGGVVDNVAGIPLSSVIVAIRFGAALWASIGLAFFVWGMVDYLLSHGNEHHKQEGRAKVAEGFVILCSFTLAWAAVKIIAHYLF